MPWKAFIFALLLAGVAVGQSSMQNVAYRPQPRIVIPNVEPAQIIVSTNGTVTANPERNLRYTDFVLCAVDQTGSLTNPVLFQYSTVDTNAQSSAVVFYQRAGTNWPSAMQRRAGSSYTATNWTYTVSTNSLAYYTNWNFVVSATNCPGWVSNSANIAYSKITNASLVLQAGDIIFTNYAPIYTATNALYVYTYGATSNGGSQFQYMRRFNPDGTASTETKGSFVRSGITAEIKTNFWSTSLTTNASYEVTTVNILSIGAASSNEAAAIEVFPVRQPSNRAWMKQTNPDVKWMALLSNSSNFYSTAEGSPVWFNCWVEWVDKIPTNGVF